MNKIPPQIQPTSIKHKFKNAFFEAYGRISIWAILLFLSFLIAHIYEFSINTEAFSFVTLYYSLLNDTFTLLLISAFTLLLAFIIALLSKRLMNYIISIIYGFLIGLHILLSIYFNKSGIPLGLDVYNYSLDDIIIVIKESGALTLSILGIFILAINVFLSLAFFISKLTSFLTKKITILSIAVTIVFISLLFLRHTPIESINEFDNHIALNKSYFFYEELIKHELNKKNDIDEKNTIALAIKPVEKKVILAESKSNTPSPSKQLVNIPKKNAAAENKTSTPIPSKNFPTKSNLLVDVSKKNIIKENKPQLALPAKINASAAKPIHKSGYSIYPLYKAILTNNKQSNLVVYQPEEIKSLEKTLPVENKSITRELNKKTYSDKSNKIIKRINNIDLEITEFDKGNFASENGINAGTGYYIIVGSYKDKNNAIKFISSKNNYPAMNIMQNKTTKNYNVYAQKLNSIEDNFDIMKFRTNYPDVWVVKLK